MMNLLNQNQTANTMVVVSGEQKVSLPTKKLSNDVKETLAQKNLELK